MTAAAPSLAALTTTATICRFSRNREGFRLEALPAKGLMNRPHFPLLALLALLAGFCGTVHASDSLFDPNKHMRVSEIRPGMKGYGLSVFMGTKIEKFDV